MNTLELWRLCQDITKGNDHRFTFTKDIGSDKMGVLFCKDMIVFSFAGTNDTKDWISNLRLMQETDRDDVHGGFYESAKQFRRLIYKVSKVIDTWFSGDKIIFTGHSRGGVLAEESHRYYIKHLHGGDVSKAEAVLFGAPLIGKAGYVSECVDLGLNVVRYVYDRDPVPDLPPFPDFDAYGLCVTLDPEWWHRLPFTQIRAHLTYHIGLRKWLV